MIYKFITDKDLDLGMKKYWRDQITDGEVRKHIMVASESAAAKIIRDYLNNRYDLTKLFPVIVNWDAVTAFTTGQYCASHDVIYKAKQDGTNQKPVAGGNAYWAESDPRDPLLVKYAAEITIYFMMQAIPPRKVNDEVANTFAGIMDWLEDVRDGHQSPDYPVLESGGSNNIYWGSNPKQNHYF